MNEIGGEKWQYAGQWIEYTVTVPESGFYMIVPRSKQDVYSGMYTSRKIYINGAGCTVCRGGEFPLRLFERLADQPSCFVGRPDAV